MSTTLVKNAHVITAGDRYDADIFINEGTIALIGQGLSLPADTVIDASGKLVMPGGVDVHTHLDMPFGDIRTTDDFETGTIAAAHGGTTTVIDFATQTRGEGLLSALETWKRQAEGKAVVDYGFHMAICDLTLSATDEMGRMARREGVTSFKLFMAYPERLMVDDGAIFRALCQARESGGLVCLHAENGSVIEAMVCRARKAGHTAPRHHASTRPARAEAEAVGRAIALAEMAEAPVYIVHLSCAAALEEVRRARQRGLPVLAETCPQYLFLSRDEYERPGFEGARFVMSPPLREPSDQEALWQGLCDRDLQVVATDHCPFGMESPPHKQLGRDDFSKIPGGIPGVETRLSLLWDGGVRTGRFDAHRFVELVATAPARIFGLWPQKGTIAVGSDGDLVVFDPDRELVLSATTLHMRVDYSPYEGRRVRGAPVTVLSRGEVVVDHGELKAAPGRGRFLKRGPSGHSATSS
jgi:dihydropyrimidinase